MSRPVEHDPDGMLDAALVLLREGGPRAVTMTAVAEATGAPSGSVYHRFPSRDALVAALWMRTVEAFQERFVAELAGGSEDAVDAALRAVRWSLGWVRANPDDARLLLLYRREDLASAEWPEDLARRAARLARRFDDEVRGFAARLRGADAQARAWFALADLPTAAVRRHLANGKKVPREVDGLLEQAVRAVLA